MPTTFSGSLQAKAQWEYTKADGTTSVVDSSNFSKTISLTNGVGTAGTGDLMYRISTTIAAGATLNIDLAGSLADVFGTTLTFARIKFFFLHLTTATAASAITVGNGTNPWLMNALSAATTTVSVRNGGFLAFGDPGATAYPVTAGTADVLKLVNADGSNIATVEICIVGGSA